MNGELVMMKGGAHCEGTNPALEEALIEAVPALYITSV
jgi:hypothetical protein